MTKRLFDRRWTVTVGSLDVSELDVRFSIEKSIRREPNTAEVEIFNLSQTSRSAIENPRRPASRRLGALQARRAELVQQNRDAITSGASDLQSDIDTVDKDIENLRGALARETPRLVVRAGYVDDGDPSPTLFVGDVRRVFSSAIDVDIRTTVRAKDGGNNYLRSRINKSYRPGTQITNVLRDCVDALQIGVGNLDDFTSAYRLRNGSNTFPDGYVASGPAHKTLSDLVRGAGLRWSVQNGALQLMQRDRPLQARATLINSSSGMVGSPTKDDRDVVTVTTLLQTGLDPGRRVNLESRLIEGEFEVRKVRYTGDTRGQEWYATLELRAIR